MTPNNPNHAPREHAVAQALDAALAAYTRGGEPALAQVLQTLPPDIRAEVAELLPLAQALQSAPRPSPSPTFRRQGRQRLMSHIRADQAVTSRRPLRPSLRNPFPTRRWIMPWLVALVTLVMTLLGGGGTVLAAQDALPGEPLYAVKSWTEDGQLALSGPERDMALLQQWTQRRIEEAQALAAQGRFDALPIALARYQKEVQQMVALIGQQQSAPATEALEPMLTHHLQVLNALVGMVPPQAQDALEPARQASQQGLEAVRCHRPEHPGGGMDTPMPTMPGGGGMGTMTPGGGMSTPMPGGGMGTPIPGGGMGTPHPGRHP